MTMLYSLRFITLTSAGILLLACSPQDQEKAREDAHKTGHQIREGAKTAGQELKKDFSVADRKVTESLEKGRESAKHAAKELRREIDDSGSNRTSAKPDRTKE